MSLAAAALQIVTVKALDGVISATVFDSMVDPVQLKDEPKPVAIVCAIEGHRDVEGRGFFEATQTVNLVIDLGVAKRVVTQVAKDQQQVEVIFPDTDAGHDLVLHTIGYEVLRALFAADPNTDGQANAVPGWGDLWRRMVPRAADEQPSIWERGASAENGVRLALVRHVFRVEVVNEPVPGAPLTELWFDLLRAMDADAETSNIATLWRSLITTPALADWKQIQVEQGLTLGGVQGLGLAPAFETDVAAAPASVTISGVDATGALTVDGDDATFTEPGGEAMVLTEERR